MIIHVTYQIGKIIPILLLILSQVRDFDIRFLLYASIVYIIIGAAIVRILRQYYWLKPGYAYLDYLTKKYINDLVQKNNLSYEAL